MHGIYYLDLWNETFNEMSQTIQELLLFHMKMEIEQRMMRRAMAPQKYEKYRMKFINLSPVLWKDIVGFVIVVIPYLCESWSIMKKLTSYQMIR